MSLVNFSTLPPADYLFQAVFQLAADVPSQSPDHSILIMTDLRLNSVGCLFLFAPLAVFFRFTDLPEILLLHETGASCT